MKTQYRMYGLQGSHFAAKLRAYLNYKGLDYEEELIHSIFEEITQKKGKGKKS